MSTLALNLNCKVHLKFHKNIVNDVKVVNERIEWKNTCFNNVSI